MSDEKQERCVCEHCEDEYEEDEMYQFGFIQTALPFLDDSAMCTYCHEAYERKRLRQQAAAQRWQDRYGDDQS